MSVEQRLVKCFKEADPDTYQKLCQLKKEWPKMIVVLRCKGKFIDIYANYEQYLKWDDNWRLLKNKIKEERGERCEKCRSEMELHLHHKTYKNIGNEKPEDLVILCEYCHKKEHLRITWGLFYDKEVEDGSIISEIAEAVT